ncbi:TylF/MycF/NovP-related O-methyltransferase [Desulfobacter latus]|uniref:Class I SAM-dependent methyltransferase n=1 Tax=Desulfobacter latus TaxID=2292 RepID=A0A850T8X6_9BACT|nr:TylF/MycF/NovP-related O-methyltransferase [Desulfobacter latus]NWH05665.1 class I SAM-dependent methyltransferase [Desulfobacter latus]
MDKCKKLYIDLLKKSLLNELYFENGMRISYLLKQMDTSCPYDLEHLLKIHEYEPELYRSFKSVFDGKEHYRERIFGFPMTMIGKQRLENVESCIQKILLDNIPGDFMETGVWRGGCTIFMNGMLEAYDAADRKVWVADSFMGVPEPKLPQDKGVDLYLDTKLAIPMEVVQENFEKFGLLNERVKFLPGWFEDTMESTPVDSLSLLRLDGDLYSSTMVVLENMYPRVEPGGFVIVDDYGALEPCRKAVTDFRNKYGIEEKIQAVDWTGVFWRKER